MNDELNRVWKEEFVAYFKELSQNSLGGTEKAIKNSITIVNVQIEIRTEHPSNIDRPSHRSHRLSQRARYRGRETLIYTASSTSN
jgi:hypothetical protein